MSDEDLAGNFDAADMTKLETAFNEAIAWLDAT
jgi:hypothetical protein